MNNILVLMTAIGLLLCWALAGLMLLPLAVIGWAVRSMQRGLRWVMNGGAA
jgi:hypothetical protein